MLLQLFGHISGAHVNPLTTVCAVIVGKIEPILVPVYVVGEVLGSVIGYGLLQVNFTSKTIVSSGVGRRTYFNST